MPIHLPKDLNGGGLCLLLEHAGSDRSRGLGMGRFVIDIRRYSHSAIRVGNYKLMKFWKERPITNDDAFDGTGNPLPVLLYNQRQDLGKTQNLAHSVTEKVR